MVIGKRTDRPIRIVKMWRREVYDAEKLKAVGLVDFTEMFTPLMNEPLDLLV